MFNINLPTLFSSRSVLEEHLEHLRAQAKCDVDRIPEEQFLNTSDDTLVEHVTSKWTVVPLQVFPEQLAMLAPTETMFHVQDTPGHTPSITRRVDDPIQVPGVTVRFHLPFTGSPFIWDYKSHEYQSWVPHGIVQRAPNAERPGYLEIPITVPAGDPPDHRIVKQKDHELQIIQQNLKQANSRVEAHNAQLKGIIRPLVEARRARLQSKRGLSGRLGIPIKPHPGAPQYVPIEMRKHVVQPLPPPPGSSYQPEPGISSDVYENILRIIRTFCRSMESTPKSYAQSGEENLRDMILANLNTHYEGRTTGETFRKKGKTDILVQEATGAAFIAECKLWTGAGGLPAACDQLTNYHTWRDCKAALIIFNKNVQNFGTLPKKILPALESSPRFLRTKSAVPDEAEWRVVLASAQDEAHEISVHVFLFNLFIAS